MLDPDGSVDCSRCQSLVVDCRCEDLFPAFPRTDGKHWRDQAAMCPDCA